MHRIHYNFKYNILIAFLKPIIKSKNCDKSWSILANFIGSMTFITFALIELLDSLILSNQFLFKFCYDFQKCQSIKQIITLIGSRYNSRKLYNVEFGYSESDLDLSESRNLEFFLRPIQGRHPFNMHFEPPTSYRINQLIKMRQFFNVN